MYILNIITKLSHSPKKSKRFPTFPPHQKKTSTDGGIYIRYDEI